MKFARSDYWDKRNSLKGYYEIFRSCTGRDAPDYDDRFSQAVLTWLDGKDVPENVNTVVLEWLVSCADWLDSCNTRHSAMFEDDRRPDKQEWLGFVVEFLDVMRQVAVGQLEEVEDADEKGND